MTFHYLGGCESDFNLILSVEGKQMCQSHQLGRGP